MTDKPQDDTIKNRIIELLKKGYTRSRQDQTEQNNNHYLTVPGGK